MTFIFSANGKIPLLLFGVCSRAEMSRFVFVANVIFSLFF